MGKLSGDAIETIYQMVSHFKNGEIEPERLLHLGEFIAYHQKLEEAAQGALSHLNWLDQCGVLTRKEEPMLKALREALAEEAESNQQEESRYQRWMT